MSKTLTSGQQFNMFRLFMHYNMASLRKHIPASLKHSQTQVMSSGLQVNSPRNLL